MGVLIETDGDLTNFEYVVASSGVTAQLEAYSNDGTPGLEPAFENYDYVAFLDQTDAVRRDEDGVHYFVDLRVSRLELSTQLGIGSSDPLHVAAISGSSVYAARADVAGCDGNVLDCSDLTNVLSDTILIDADGDGLTDPPRRVRWNKFGGTRIAMMMVWWMGSKGRVIRMAITSQMRWIATPIRMGF